MHGSQRQEFAVQSAAAAASNRSGVRVFAVQLPGQTFWGWHRQGEKGDIVAHSEHLFSEYVACLCDAHGRS